MSKTPRLELIIDSREQKSLKDEFKAGIFDIIISKKLEYGDYGCTIDGKEVPIYFERKGLGDLFGTLTKDHKRFGRELHRAKLSCHQLILLVEGSLRDVASGYSHSSISGDTIIKTIFSLWVRHGLYPVFCNGRRECARFIEETYTAVARSFSIKGKRSGAEHEDERKLAE